jgi:hypothetical protein
MLRRTVANRRRRSGRNDRDRVHVALDLVESRTFDGRLQLLEYVPTVLDRPPGVGGWPE